MNEVVRHRRLPAGVLPLGVARGQSPQEKMDGEVRRVVL